MFKYGVYDSYSGEIELYEIIEPANKDFKDAVNLVQNTHGEHAILFEIKEFIEGE